MGPGLDGGVFREAKIYRGFKSVSIKRMLVTEVVGKWTVSILPNSESRTSVKGTKKKLAPSDSPTTSRVPSAHQDRRSRDVEGDLENVVPIYPFVNKIQKGAFKGLFSLRNWRTD